MYNWLLGLIGIANPTVDQVNSITSGCVICSCAIVIFLLWTFSRLFRR